MDWNNPFQTKKDDWEDVYLENVSLANGSDQKRIVFVEDKINEIALV